MDMSISEHDVEGFRKERRRRAQVEDEHLVAAREELLGDVQADEAGAAAEQDHGSM